MKFKHRKREKLIEIVVKISIGNKSSTRNKSKYKLTLCFLQEFVYLQNQKMVGNKMMIGVLEVFPWVGPTQGVSPNPWENSNTQNLNKHCALYL